MLPGALRSVSTTGVRSTLRSPHQPAIDVLVFTTIVRSIAPDRSDRDRDQRPEAQGRAMPWHRARSTGDPVYEPLNHHALAPPAFRMTPESRESFTPPSIPPVSLRESPRKCETPRSGEVTAKGPSPGVIRDPVASPFSAERRATAPKTQRSPFPSGDDALAAARSRDPFSARPRTRQEPPVTAGVSPPVEPPTKAQRAIAAVDRGLELIASKEYRRAREAWGEALALDPANRTLQANLRRLERLLASTEEDRLR